jgi:nicotinamidase-related amidase
MIMPIISLNQKRVVIDIDTQRHFFTSGSTVCVRDHRRVLANILRVVNWARHENVGIYSTVQLLGDECRQGLPVTVLERYGKMNHTYGRRYAAVKADDCTDLPDGVLEQQNQVILYKRSYDPFGERKVDRILTELQASEFILIGALTEAAVKTTALGLLARQKNVTVVTDATGSFAAEPGEVALRIMAERGVRLVSTKDLLAFSCLELPKALNIA